MENPSEAHFVEMARIIIFALNTLKKADNSVSAAVKNFCVVKQAMTPGSINVPINVETNTGVSPDDVASALNTALSASGSSLGEAKISVDGTLKDDTECTNGNNSCNANADCSETFGSYVCRCKVGYQDSSIDGARPGSTCAESDCHWFGDECLSLTNYILIIILIILVILLLLLFLLCICCWYYKKRASKKSYEANEAQTEAGEDDDDRFVPHSPVSEHSMTEIGLQTEEMESEPEDQNRNNDTIEEIDQELQNENEEAEKGNEDIEEYDKDDEINEEKDGNNEINDEKGNETNEEQEEENEVKEEDEQESKEENSENSTSDEEASKIVPQPTLSHRERRHHLNKGLKKNSRDAGKKYERMAESPGTENSEVSVIFDDWTEGEYPGSVPTSADGLRREETPLGQSHKSRSKNPEKKKKKKKKSKSPKKKKTEPLTSLHSENPGRRIIGPKNLKPPPPWQLNGVLD